ncbi:hypothetical protein O3P69_005707 [Scylla paramamosain]|uniref:Uncharacterized protein n=1 Tax=Scylla paramamosain TaxID=85552 RepID=A0AAW0U6X3_SCYPA
MTMLRSVTVTTLIHIMWLKDKGILMPLEVVVTVVMMRKVTVRVLGSVGGCGYRLLHEAETFLIAAEDDNVQVVAMDPQQTLLCPQLCAGVAFYKRKLWLYNLCIYISLQEATMFGMRQL